MDTNSYGFHVAVSQPTLLPFAQGERMTKVAWFQTEEEDAQLRRAQVFRAAQSLFRSVPRGSWIFVEEPLILTVNQATTRILCMIAGVLEAALVAANADATLCWVPVSTWRKEVLGVGSGRSAELKLAALEKARTLWTTQDRALLAELYEAQPDLADATCVMLYGVSELQKMTTKEDE